MTIYSGKDVGTQGGFFEQCFGGDAPDVEADATQPIRLHTGYAQTHLGRPNPGDVAPGATPDDDQIEAALVLGHIAPLF